MAANYALAISAVSRKGKAYPDMRALHLQLDKLYGAAISVTANKSGGCQILKMGITTLDDRFALDDEKIAEAGLELLMNLLFDPLLGEDGLFSPADIETERRVLLEKLAAEENEKRLYAVMQMQQIMFAGDPYRINPKGTKEPSSLHLCCRLSSARSQRGSWQGDDRERTGPRPDCPGGRSHPGPHV